MIKKGNTISIPITYPSAYVLPTGKRYPYVIFSMMNTYQHSIYIQLTRYQNRHFRNSLPVFN